MELKNFNEYSFLITPSFHPTRLQTRLQLSRHLVNKISSSRAFTRPNSKPRRRCPIDYVNPDSRDTSTPRAEQIQLVPALCPSPHQRLPNVTHRKDGVNNDREIIQPIIPRMKIHQTGDDRRGSFKLTKDGCNSSTRIIQISTIFLFFIFDKLFESDIITVLYK